MKYFQRYLSLLFALVMCVSVFSTTAHAEKAIQENYRIIQSGNFKAWDGTIYPLDYLEFDLNNKLSKEKVTSGQSWLTNYSLYSGEYWQHYQILNTDNTYIMQKDTTYNVKLNQFYFSAFAEANVSYYVRNPKSVDGWVIYSDNTTETIEVQFAHTSNYPLIDFTFSFTPTKDVQAFEIRVKADTANTQPTSNAVARLTSYYGFVGDSNYQFIVNIQSEEAGLLKDIGSKLSSGFSNMIKGITELPQKLWEKISEGLKSLFVPSEETMTAYKDKWDELLSSRFGAVYQVVNIMTESWEGIMEADETGIIEFPQATVNLCGASFSFGGYDVKVVPDGFEVIVTPLKSIVAIVCTVGFVNGLRKRYDEIMGVE